MMKMKVMMIVMLQREDEEDFDGSGDDAAEASPHHPILCRLLSHNGDVHDVAL